MKKLLGGVAVAALLVGAPALAADMAAKAPVYKAPPSPPAPVFSWTGCYVGGNFGVGRTSKHFTYTATTSGFTGDLFDEGSLHQSGFVGGGQLGCDYQVGSNFVVGVQGMFDGTAIIGSESFIQPAAGTLDTYSANLSWFATTTARVGWLASPAVLLYAKGGAAWVNEKIDWNAPGIATNSTGHVTREGWDAGGGVEWMFAPQWSLFVEYDHLDFGTKDMQFYNGASGRPTFIGHITQSVDMAVLGLNWRFNGAAMPVSSR